MPHKLREPSSKGPDLKPLTKIAFIATALPLLAALGKWAAVRAESQDLVEPLALKWEGAIIGHNFRDAGKSLNDCLGRTAFQENQLFRANVWFSGWSCDNVGNPDIVYSLNYDPARSEQYFCEGHNGPLVGKHFNTKKLHDLEFVGTWDDQDTTLGACGFIQDALSSISAGKRVLLHCDAGKDRTGTVVAMLAALTLEARGELNSQTIDAIECDYQKSHNLEKSKYGRMRAFIGDMASSGGVAKFLSTKCGIGDDVVTAATDHIRTPRL